MPLPAVEPYKFPKPSLLRDITKLVVLIGINAGDAESTVAAVRWEVAKSNDLKAALANSEYKDKKLGAMVWNLYNDFINYHQPIKQYFGSGLGIELQRWDSDIASQVMWHFTQREIPVLNIYDGFIIEEQYGGELEQVMQNAYKAHHLTKCGSPLRSAKSRYSYRHHNQSQGRL